MKTDHLLSRSQKQAPQTYRNIYVNIKRTLEDVLIRWKYLRLKIQATTKDKWHKLIFDANKKSLWDFLEDLNDFAEKVIGPLEQQIIDSPLYAKLPPLLKQSIKLAYFGNGANDGKVAYLEEKLKFSGLGTDRKIHNPTMASTATTVNKQNQPPNTKQQQFLWRNCKKTVQFIGKNR